MNHRNVVSRILIIVLGVCCAGPLKADFGLGVAAYKRGDYGTAQLHFRPLAEAGDARGQFALGLLHDNGEGVPRDDAVAASWYARSAAQGYAKAQYNLALMIEAGRTRQEESARVWFGRAALRGNADAVTRLHAFASAGDLAAALQLGRMYALGRGVQPSPRDAETWLSRAAQGDAPGAAFALAALLEREARDEAAFAAAAQWYEHAAAAGEARAQYNLARLYRLGHGVPRDLERARVLYEAAAEQGSIRAQVTLAMLFEGGESWPRDEAAALAWYRRAALAGSAEAQVNLAVRYAEGRGLTRDVLEACALLEVARERGLALAAVNHAFLCAQLAPHERATVAARVARYRAGGVAEEGIATGVGAAVEARDDASGARGAAATAAPS